jgi:hypothetical protein
LLLTLLVTPVAYSLLDDLAQSVVLRRLGARVSALAHPFRRKRRAEKIDARREEEEVEVGASSGD